MADKAETVLFRTPYIADPVLAEKCAKAVWKVLEKERKPSLEEAQAALRAFSRWSEDMVRAMSLLAPNSLLLEHLRGEAADLQELARALGGSND